jgi:hypothetical protein
MFFELLVKGTISRQGRVVSVLLLARNQTKQAVLSLTGATFAHRDLVNSTLCSS